ncbi:MAG: methionine aminotransferase [Saprospiraceae bacterium]
MHIESKLPHVGETIFSVMSAAAQRYGAVNLSQGFPNYDPPERLMALVNEHIRRGANQYAPMPGHPLLRRRIADKMQALYGLSLDPDAEITITAGATQALFCAIAALVRPGDEVILLEPCYDSYRPSVETVGGVAVPYALRAPDFRPDWEEIGALVTSRTRLIVVNTPHNPTGVLLEDADMRALERLLADTNIALLSDEVYEHLIFDGATHRPALCYPGLRDRAFCIYSFGKTYHNTGWKTGYCIAPPTLSAEFRKVHQFNVFCANHPMQAALADFLEDAEAYLSLPDFYEAKRDLFADLMRASPLSSLPCRGSYFQLYSYAHLSDESDRDFCMRLTCDYGVAAIPMSAFYSDGRDERLIRFCFAKTADTLQEAGARLSKLTA